MRASPQSIVASITIAYHASGEMSISGNIGDVTLALGMLDHAREAVSHQLRPKGSLVIPSRDVAVRQHPAFPTVPAGDLRA